MNERNTRSHMHDFLFFIKHTYLTRQVTVIDATCSLSFTTRIIPLILLNDLTDLDQVADCSFEKKNSTSITKFPLHNIIVTIQ